MNEWIATRRAQDLCEVTYRASHQYPSEKEAYQTMWDDWYKRRQHGAIPDWAKLNTTVYFKGQEGYYKGKVGRGKVVGAFTYPLGEGSKWRKGKIAPHDGLPFWDVPLENALKTGKTEFTQNEMQAFSKVRYIDLSLKYYIQSGDDYFEPEKATGVVVANPRLVGSFFRRKIEGFKVKHEGRYIRMIIVNNKDLISGRMIGRRGKHRPRVATHLGEHTHADKVEEDIFPFIWKLETDVDDESNPPSSPTDVDDDDDVDDSDDSEADGVTVQKVEEVGS
jgi:hypothetical protein